MNFNKIILLLLINLFCQFRFHALGNIILSDNNNRINITKQFEIVEDTENKITSLQITSGKFDSSFLANKIETKLFNRQKRTFWARLKTESQTNKNTEWLLRFWNYYSLIDCYTVYSNGLVTKQTGGWSLGLNERSVNNAELLFKVLLEPNESGIVYLHITSDPAWNNPPEIRAEIISSDAWTTIERNHWLLNGLVTGLVIIATVFAILNFVYGRKLYLLSLALSNLIILFYFLNSNNIISTFLFSHYPWYTISRLSLIYICLPAFVSSIGLLFITFGELNKILPVTSRLYIRLTSFIIIVSIAIPALSLSESLMQYFYVMLFGWTIFHLVVWITLARKNNIIGKAALICYTAIGIGLFIECLRQTYMIEDNIFIHNAFQVSAALTITISMFTFLNFTRKLRKKKIKAQKEYLKVLEANRKLIIDQNVVLEQKVESRTRELKETQMHLMRQEKLASLGQLTAGIAHEIKNPLNFVNNFSDISSELVEEIKSSRNENERNEILTNLKNNLLKISHHGKRADNIVQSMLQYSRNSIGEKQLIDLNKLCDEYFKLSFQGIRATYPEFNCEMIKKLDTNIPNVNFAPFDIGSVMLNLFNNAFYAVNEKEKSCKNANYAPVVLLSIGRHEKSIIIRVIDNGIGIPENIKEKIFNPFFTTKPAGKGAGLGLSLSYDIIVANGGDMKLESSSGEETKFMIELPLNI